MSRSYFAKSVLLDTGWAKNVRITLSDDGFVGSILTDTQKEDAELIRGILIPGMPNIHSHAFQRAFSGFLESLSQTNDSFWSWRKTMYHFVDKLNPQQAFIIARQLYIEMLKAGYTSVTEFHYLHHDNNGNSYDDPAEMSHSVINAAFDTGIGITFLPVYYRYSGFDERSATQEQRRFIQQPENYHRLIDALFGHYRSDNRIRIGIAPHSLRAVRGSDINAASNIIDGYDPDAPIHIHIAEQTAEVNDCLKSTQQRPVQHLFEQCDVNKRWCLVHATHINDQEAWELAESGAVAGLCLTTEANLGDGIFPTPFYLERQGSFGIGSDSHISVSPFEELKLLEYTQRLQQQKRTILCDHKTPSVGSNLYQRALAGGKRASGRQTGKIAAGYQADWLVLDEDNPALFSKSDEQILDAVIFASHEHPVKDVMVSGKWVINNRSHALEEQSLGEYRTVLDEIMG